MSASGGASVIVNGETTPLPAGGRLLDVLQALHIEPETRGVAVALNESIVPRARWQTAHVRPGDRIEVVRAVQGG
jgi:sulfur carrier protein